jgi:Schlafen, AlbA_2
MATSDLSVLIAAKSEALEVEYKAWMDTSLPEIRAKIARHLAALANHGGGYLIFGVDDVTKAPQGPTTLSPTLFGEDALSAIVKKYLDPRFQCRIEWASYGDVEYPVVIVPSHSARPVIAIADGPQDGKRQPVGIRQGAIYVRAAGPESIAIQRADDWTALLERCLTHRADLLANIMRQAIGQPSKASTAVTSLLKAACQSTAQDFAEQAVEVAETLDTPSNQAHLRHMADNFAVIGYALVGEDGELLPIESLRGACTRADVQMHQSAYFGWNAFLPLHVPERAPQIRVETLLGQERSFLEGMRIANSGLLGAAFDYWRIYEDGVCSSAESYREDYKSPLDRRVLRVRLCLVKLHSVLAHARFVGQEMPSLGRVIVHMDWKGLSGRMLMWDDHRLASPTVVAADRFVKTINVDWGELRGDYFQALRRVSLPFFDFFACPGWLDPETWFTREMVEREFAELGARMRLLEP